MEKINSIFLNYLTPRSQMFMCSNVLFSILPVLDLPVLVSVNVPVLVTVLIHSYSRSLFQSCSHSRRYNCYYSRSRMISFSCYCSRSYSSSRLRYCSTSRFGNWCTVYKLMNLFTVHLSFRYRCSTVFVFDRSIPICSRSIPVPFLFLPVSLITNYIIIIKDLKNPDLINNLKLKK